MIDIDAFLTTNETARRLYEEARSAERRGDHGKAMTLYLAIEQLLDAARENRNVAEPPMNG